MKCPVCRAIYRPAGRSQESGVRSQAVEDSHSSLPTPHPPCKRCGADLTRLIQLHDRSVQHYRQAILSLQAAEYAAAQDQVQQAIGLNHRNPDFHALAGQLWALQGEFSQAIAAWKQALHLDPAHKMAKDCLQILLELSHQTTEAASQGNFSETNG